MTQLDFRALAQELVEELEAWIAYGDEADCARAHAVVDRALAALATPPPAPPTDREIREWLDPRRFACEESAVIIRAALEMWGHG